MADVVAPVAPPAPIAPVVAPTLPTVPVVAPIPEKKYFIDEKIDETPEVLIIRFKPEDGAKQNFDPGMFYMISGLDKVTQQKQIARAFSVASDPGNPDLEYFIIKGHPGHTSHFVEAGIGDPFMMKGPSGQFKFNPTRDKKVLFIAGGTGLSPFMSMIRHIKSIGSDNDVILLYSVKFPTEIIRKQELEDFKTQLKLNLVVTVTRPDPADGWSGQTGHIDNLMIEKYTPDLTERMTYVCGPLPFVKAIKDALTLLKVPTDRVSADVWG